MNTIISLTVLLAMFIFDYMSKKENKKTELLQFGEAVWVNSYGRDSQYYAVLHELADMHEVSDSQIR